MAFPDRAGRGGYGVLRFFVDDNTGFREGSIISCVAIAIIPLILCWPSTARLAALNGREAVAVAPIFAALPIPIRTVA